MQLLLERIKKEEAVHHILSYLLVESASQNVMLQYLTTDFVHCFSLLGKSGKVRQPESIFYFQLITRNILGWYFNFVVGNLIFSFPSCLYFYPLFLLLFYNTLFHKIALDTLRSIKDNRGRKLYNFAFLGLRK